MTSHSQHDACDAPGDAPGTLVDFLRRAAAQRPDARIVADDADGGAAEPGLTYAALDLEARAIAAALQIAGVRAGDGALLFYPRGLALLPALFGCLYAGVVAVPAPLPPVGEPEAAWRLALGRGIRPSIALTTCAWLPAARVAVAGVDALEDLPWLVSDAVSPETAATFRAVPLGPDAAALVEPVCGAGAGAVVTHARLLDAPPAPASRTLAKIALLRARLADHAA